MTVLNRLKCFLELSQRGLTMVKRSVIKKRSRKTPPKKRQAQNKSKKKINKLGISPSPSSPSINTPADIMNEDVNNVNTSSSDVLNATTSNDNGTESEASFIIINDTILDKSTVSISTSLDESCFIIDVDGAPVPDAGTLFPFNEKIIVTDNQVDNSKNADMIMDVNNDDKQPSQGSDDPSSKRNVEKNKDCNIVESHQRVNSMSNASCKEDDLQPTYVLRDRNIPQINYNNKNTLKDIYNQINEGHLNQLSYKRKFIDNDFRPNKRFLPSSEGGNQRNWSTLKKTRAEKTNEQTLSTSICKKPEPNILTEPKSLNDNSSSENETCISVNDDSDSDVEFVQAFNPQDQLIELSDSEESVVCEDISPPLMIKVPSVKPKKKKRSKKDSPKEATRSPAQNKTKTTVNQSKPAKVDLRPIVIDGCNVGMGHSKSKFLSVAGLKICFDYFHDRGHDVKIFLPQFKKYHPMTSDPVLLDKMEREGTVIFTPGRRVEGKLIGSYDDRFILEYASLKEAIVVTRDNYRDLYSEREEFKDTIKSRLLQYTFVDDLIMFPQDPLGRNGPSLEEFLQVSPKTDKPSSKKS